MCMFAYICAWVGNDLHLGVVSLLRAVLALRLAASATREAEIRTHGRLAALAAAAALAAGNGKASLCVLCHGVTRRDP
jgi:hypothetical protein